MHKLFGRELNDAQYEAIIHRDGPMLVIAGPGSGKTTVITNRIRYLIEKHKLPPEEILVITFTKAAAQEMQERFQKLMDNVYYPVRFGTFHAIYFHILKQAYHFETSNIISETEKKSFLREAISRVLQENNMDEAQAGALTQEDIIPLLLAEFGNVKNHGIPIQKYHTTIMEETLFRNIYKTYQQLLFSHRKLDFDDMMLLCYELFQKHPEILAHWQKQFQYILIDEFQDICPMQYYVMQMLAKPNNNLFIVGDDDQSIYRFRGSTPQIMLQFPAQYPQAKQILLNYNYRCSKPIVEASIHLISHNLNRFQKEILAIQKDEYGVEYQTFPNEEEQNRNVVVLLQQYEQQGGELDEAAILFRTNVGMAKIAEKCMIAQIPFFMKEKVQNIYEQQVAQDMLAYLHLALGEQKREYFYRIMNKPTRYFSRNAVLGPMVKKEELLQYYRDKPYMLQNIETLWIALARMKDMSPYAAINYIRKGMGYDTYISELAWEKRRDEKQWMEQLDALQENAKYFDTIQEFFLHIEKYSKELQKAKQTKKPEHAVELMTMHSAKGLEWELVVIPDMNEGVIPHKKASTKEEIEEERRMLYVAMTRAKKRLFLFSVETNEQYVATENKKVPSRFIREIFTSPNDKTTSRPMQG